MDIPTIGLVLPLIRSLQQQAVASLAAARVAGNASAVMILTSARDAYVDYFEHWVTNDLLLAATLLDPTQASAYFAPLGPTQADATTAVALLETAWTSIVHIGTQLHNKELPALVAPEDDDVGVAPPAAAVAFAGLIGLLGGVGAAAGGAAAGAAVYTLADERPSFFAAIQEEFVKRAGDRVSACSWYRKNMGRIPKIAAM